MNTSTQQSIVVYTNPYHRDFYESGMMIPLLGALGTILILFLLLMSLCEKVLGNHRINTWVMGGAALASLGGGMLVFQLMFV